MDQEKVLKVFQEMIDKALKHENTELEVKEDNFCIAVFRFTGRSPLEGFMHILSFDDGTSVYKKTSRAYHGYVHKCLTVVKFEVFAKKNTMVIKVASAL